MRVPGLRFASTTGLSVRTTLLTSQGEHVAAHGAPRARSKNLSINNIDVRWHLAERDDRSREVVERNEAALQFLVAHE